MTLKFYTGKADSLLPHQAPMVLIHSPLGYNQEQLQCTCLLENAGHHPLAIDGVLSVYAGVEYAAQAMAAHARLTAHADAASAPRKGFVAVASKLNAEVANLNSLGESIVVSVCLLASNKDSSMYSFNIHASQQLLLSGQLMAVLAED